MWNTAQSFWDSIQSLLILASQGSPFSLFIGNIVRGPMCQRNLKESKSTKCKKVKILQHNIQDWYGNYLLPVVLRIILQSSFQIGFLCLREEIFPAEGKIAQLWTPIASSYEELFLFLPFFSFLMCQCTALSLLYGTGRLYPFL